MTQTDPALSYTLTDFIDYGKHDDITYSNFSIYQYATPIKFAEQNVLDYYITELRKLCNIVTGITPEQISKYKYAPDLFAYDVYGSTQLDFIVLLCNGIIDPKEFDFKRGYLTLPRADVLSEFLSAVYNSENGWITTNRAQAK